MLWNKNVSVHWDILHTSPWSALPVDSQDDILLHVTAAPNATGQQRGSNRHLNYVMSVRLAIPSKSTVSGWWCERHNHYSRCCKSAGSETCLQSLQALCNRKKSLYYYSECIFIQINMSCKMWFLKLLCLTDRWCAVQ